MHGHYDSLHSKGNDAWDVKTGDISTKKLGANFRFASNRSLGENPWARTAPINGDFILIAEFSENEGPIPVMTIPKNGGVNFDINAFAVHVMSVDYTQARGANFSLVEDTQLLLSQKKDGIYAYVHHFTLYDIHARGFVRPFCMCYISRCKRKMFAFLDHLMDEFTKVSRLFRHGNRITFLQDLEQRLAEVLALRDSSSFRNITREGLVCQKWMCGDKISQVGTTSSVSSRTATSTSTSPSSASFPATISNFETFRERKETERRSFSVRKKSCSKKQRIQDSEVCITVGLMKNRKTVKRGERLPVKLSTSATAIDILEAAKKKHAAYNKRFRAGEYRLVYKDGSDVDVIPGTDEPFSLRRYKEESGFGYARINLFLLPASTIFDELQESLQETDSDIGDDLDGLEPDADHQELLQPVEWLQPSCTSGHTYNADANAWSRETEGKIECPTCFKQFPIDEVSLHADECADAFWERVGDEKEITLQNNVEDGLSQKDLKSEILQLRLRHLKEKEEAVRVTVRRKNIWDDFKRSRERYYTPDRILKVTFSGEPAVDSGGPKREFFAEVLSYVETRLFVEGIPSKSTISLNRGDFKLAGEVMAMSIVQHGQAPNFLAPEIYAYFSGNLQIQDITSPSHREFCEKIQRATNEELPDILQAEDAYPFLEEVGYHGVPARETKESIENVVRSICINLQVGKVLPQLVQLHEGLSTCGVLGAVQKSPKLWESAFVSGAGYSVTANNLIEEIQPEFSVSQMKKEKEADCYHYLCEFIHSLEAKSIEELGVADFLKWLTGSRNYPPLGFPKKIRCQFLHGCPGSCKCRPTTSTCDLVFTLPVHLNTEEEMGLLMTSALTDSFGFTLL